VPPQAGTLALASAPSPTLSTWIETVAFGTAGEVRKLLDSGFDPNTATVGKTTALMLAVPVLLAASIDFGDTAMIELLLKAGARVDVRTPEGKTALDLAREYGHQRFVPVLQGTQRTGQ